MKLWTKVIGGVTTTLVLGATPLVPVFDGYYVRLAPADKAQFSKVERNADIKGLQEAHIIGSACYDQFVDPTGKLEKKRDRIDCEEYWKRANIPDYPTPKIEGYVWGSYVTHLFDTPSGDLEEGYYAKTDDVVNISVAQAALEGLTPVAEAAISLDAVSDQTADSTAVSSLSWSHTISSLASSTILVVGIGMVDSTDGDRTVNNATHNGDQMFKLREDDENTDNRSTHIRFIIDPDLGTKTITATLSGSNSLADGGALSIHGIDHGTPIDAQSSSAAAGNNVSAQVTTVADASWMFAAASLINGGGETYTINPGGIEIGNLQDVGTAGGIMTGYFGPQVTAGLASTTWICSGGSCSGNDWITSQASFDSNCASVGETCTQYFRETGIWTAPTGVSSTTVACWGGGGGGGNPFGVGDGGGGGGAYVRTSGISVTGGTNYTVTIGTGGSAESNGGDSYFDNGSQLLADGGTGAAGSGGSGGTTANSVGTVEYAGGSGGDGAPLSNAGGGAGGAAGPDGAGNDGSDGSGSTGGAGGSGDAGLGGAGGGANSGGSRDMLGGGGGGGGNANANGGFGAIWGSGGGGGGYSSGTGSPGANGACLITWVYPSEAAAVSLPLIDFLWFE